MKSIKMEMLLPRVTALLCIFSPKSDANLNPPLRTHKRFIEVAPFDSKVSKISTDIFSSLQILVNLFRICYRSFHSVLLYYLYTVYTY
uniref:SJCHGC02126 protein n=1 Tax=Schistosoma japonicum TaxID=6182 RepID=Q5BTB1_SCHJA|nr:SJCHGC02126 protein [Schistosoma japonicum]